MIFRKSYKLIPVFLFVVLFSGMSPYSGLGLWSHTYLNPLHQAVGIPRSWVYFSPEPLWAIHEYRITSTKQKLIPHDKMHLKNLGREREKIFRHSVLTFWSDPDAQGDIKNWICRYFANVPLNQDLSVVYLMTEIESIRKKKEQHRLLSTALKKFEDNHNKPIGIRCLF